MGPYGASGPVYGERGGVRWLGTDGVVENRCGAAVTGGSGGGANKMNGRVLFYSRTLHEGNADLRKGRGR
jgi:hypothetical protein